MADSAVRADAESAPLLSGSDGKAAAAAAAGDGDAAISIATVVPYRATRRRVAVLLVYCLASLPCSVMQFTYATISDTARQWYGVSTLELNLMVMLYQLAYLPFTFAAAYVMQRMSLYKSFLIGVAGNAMSVWLRYAASGQDLFWLGVAGQAIGASAQPFIGMNCVTLLANNWFTDKDRTIASTFGSLFNVLGSGLIYGVGPVIVSTGSDIATLLLAEAGFTTAVGILGLAVFRSRPAVFPSASAAARVNAKQDSFGSQLKAIGRNRDFILLLLAFSLGFAVFQGFSGLINQIVLPAGFSADDAGIFGLLLIAGGIVGAVLVGILVDVTKRHRIFMYVCLIVAFAGVIALPFALEPHLYGLVCAIVFMLGFFVLALMPVALELGAECTYPVAESTSSGLLVMGGTLLSCVFTIAMDRVQTAFNMFRAPLYFMIGGWALAVLLSIGFRGKNLRAAAEAAEKAQRAAAATTVPVNQSSGEVVVLHDASA